MIILLIIVLLVLLVLIFYNDSKKKNSKNNLYYYRDNFCGLINKEIFKKYNILKTTNLDTCNLYIPSSYTYSDREYKNVFNKKFYIYMIHGCDYLASKNMLYHILYISLNNSLLNKIVPETWIINKKEHIDLFKKKFNENNIYILKKNIQQKKGIYLSNNFEDILENMNNYNIIQKYINNTFLINKRKITLRIYLLIVYKNNKLDFYVHKNGKCLYTTKNYNKFIEKNLLESDYSSFITSSPNNLDLDIYNKNPHTLKELEEYLTKNKYNYYLLYKNIIKNIKIIKTCYYNILYNKNKICNNTCFQLFGMDYIFNNNLDTFLLEINKGPNMVPISQKDFKLKYNIIEDVFDKVKFIKKNKQNLFIKI